ncbi:CD320 antigen isoform X2 [Ascaphus truei]|uniref:CD320 antigen isoform X2 n=1 Tax=Ascaphus truei TaxID=8439 RepID=UPI003F592FD0
MWSGDWFLACIWLGTLQTEPRVSGSPVTCLHNQYKCPDGSCIPGLWRCDGDEDCPDGTDEATCQEAPCAGFRCTDGHCVALTWRCDGHFHCADGSDEDPLICGNSTCPPAKFQCRNRQCVSTKLVCNGHNDCTDRSDEEACEPASCSPSSFPCGSSCLPLSLLCNGKIDCPGGLDESEGKCKPVHRPHCSAEEFSCDQHCVPQTWRCDGHTDCEDESDEDKCGSQPLLLIFNNSAIHKLNLDGEDSGDVEFGLEKVSALTGDWASSEIFWPDGERRVIFGKSLDMGTQRREIIKHLRRPTGLSVDWIYKLVYWIDAESRTISVASLDGLKTRKLYKDNISQPASLAVDPQTGFIFWSDIGEIAKIEKAAMIGNSRIQLVSVDIHKPLALTLDVKHSYVYWVDSELNTISRIGMDGQHRKVVLQSKQFLSNPSGIAVFEDLLFWSDLEREAIYSMQRRVHANVTTVAYMRNPAGLIILAREVQANSVNLCLEQRAQCPFLCVPSPWTSEHSPTFSCLSADHTESDDIQHKSGNYLPVLVTEENRNRENPSESILAIGKENEMSYNRSLVIAVSVFFSLALLSCILIRCRTKTNWGLLNNIFFEMSKKYLKQDMDRTASSAYMLTDLKNEEEDA